MGEYETSLQERERHDAEIAADNKARQIRLGDVPAEEKKDEVPTEPESAETKTEEK